MIEQREAFELYERCWDAGVDPATRAELLDRAWADGGALFEPELEGGAVGREAVAAYIESALAESPEMVVTTTEPPEMVSGRLRAKWEQHEKGALAYAGVDFVEFADDGRIARLTMFFDVTPA